MTEGDRALRAMRGPRDLAILRPVWSLTPSRGALAGVVLIAGLAVGALTSLGQIVLPGALGALVNSASAWLVAPFAVGVLARGDAEAAVAGVSVCALQLLGYDTASHLRGLPVGGNAITVFWAVCGLVGGPTFGVCGRRWLVSRGPVRGLAGGALPSAFLAEGIWTYGHVLGYRGTTVLWLAIGTSLALALTRGWGERPYILAPLLLGLVTQALLTTAYAASF